MFSGTNKHKMESFLVRKHPWPYLLKKNIYLIETWLEERILKVAKSI